ncbi:MAG: NAD(+)/NADH kinase [Chloroflexi bacterium]|nr:NAD(+)/NADH kinase [Chloroflexota bacterium]
MVTRVGVIYHPKVETSRPLAERLATFLSGQQVQTWSASAWDEEALRPQIQGSDFLVCLGGDGTLLRVARAAVPWAVPIVGVNQGRLGFITEVQPEDALKSLPLFLDGKAWVDERAMLAVRLPRPYQGLDTVTALNDAVVSRGAIARIIRVKTQIDGEVLTTYRGDGVIVASATGSTGYNLAAAGPILYPQSRDLILTPITPHLSLSNTLVLPGGGVICLLVQTDHQAMLSLDGQVHITLESGDAIKVRRSPHVARFLRLRPPGEFYRTLTRRLASPDTAGA